ncbi:MAG: hypothetical protein H0U98_14175 [Alphaproteobacteria bacterium]|nr:hypothetical protein [Alphaproteobacteria bacterium]
MLRPPALNFALNFALGAALAAFGLAVLSPGLLNDGDTYWHIRAGEWMIAHRAVLRADVFSYTVAGAPWHTQEWLAEIAMALGWRSGWSGIHLLFAAAAALTAGVTAWFVRRRVDFVPALLAVVLGLSCVTGSLLARPHMLALPLLAIWTVGLAQAREKNESPSCWLIAVMPLWANLHGSFAFGLALAGALAVEAVIEDRKAALGWAVFLLGATLSCLATPYGIAGLEFPFKLSAMRALDHISEWQASDFSHISPFVISLFVTLFVMSSGRLRVPAFRLAVLLGVVWMALAHGRHQMLLGVTAPILLAPSLANAWPAKNGITKAWLLPLLAAGFAALILVRLTLPVARTDDPVSPVTAMAHVPRFVRETPVLNDYSFGGYLIWDGLKPFIDSRADLYGDIFLQNYAAITAPDKDALAATLTFYHVRWTIFNKDAAVVKLLDATPGWHRFYADKLAVVHVHD